MDEETPDWLISI